MSTTPRTWVVGEVVTAAEMNTEIRDQFSDLFAAWTSWTPTLGASTTAPTNLDLFGRYKQVGKSVLGQFSIGWNASSTAGSGTYQGFTLPVAGRRLTSNVEVTIGTCQLNLTNTFNGALVVASGSGNYTSAARFRFSDMTTVANGGIGTWTSSAPGTPASGTVCQGQFMYEAA